MTDVTSALLAYGAWVILGVAGGVVAACTATPQEVSELVSRVIKISEEQLAAQAQLGEVLSDDEVRALVQQSIDLAVRGTPWEGAGLGAVGTAILGIVATFLLDRRKNSRKRGEQWAAIGELQKKNGGT